MEQKCSPFLERGGKVLSSEIYAALHQMMTSYFWNIIFLLADKGQLKERKPSTWFRHPRTCRFFFPQTSWACCVPEWWCTSAQQENEPCLLKLDLELWAIPSDLYHKVVVCVPNRQPVLQKVREIRCKFNRGRTLNCSHPLLENRRQSKSSSSCGDMTMFCFFTFVVTTTANISQRTTTLWPISEI